MPRAEIGDIVKVPRVTFGPLGTMIIQIHKRLLIGEVLDVRRLSFGDKYTIKLENGDVRHYPGMHIREVVERRGDRARGKEHDPMEGPASIH